MRDDRWQDGSTAPHYTIMKEGVYSLQVSNECGTYTDAITVISGLSDIQRCLCMEHPYTSTAGEARLLKGTVILVK